MTEGTSAMSAVIDPPEISRSATSAAARRVGPLLLIGGQVPTDHSGNLVGPGDIRAQTHQVYQNIVTILNACGASVGDLIQLRTYYVDLAHRSDIIGVRREYMGDHRPCSTAVVVKSLANPDWFLEVEAMAYLAK